MKKLFTILMILLVLCACVTRKEETPQTDEADLSSLTIVTPKGAPVLAFYDQIANENYTRVAADAISALWTGDQSPDVLVVDLSSGIKAIGNGAEYKVAAIITFGNFYLAATGNDEDGELSAGDRIVLFGNEGMLPNKIWHYLYGEDYDEGLIFVTDAQTASAALASGADLEGNEVDYVFCAQPALTAALKKNENASVYRDIQEEYAAKSGLSMIQAAVFIRNSVSSELGNAFLDHLQEAVAAVTADPDVAKEGLSVYTGDEATAQYGINPDLAISVLKQKNASGMNAMGLGFRRAIDIKDDIDAFLELLGAKRTGEEIYFQ